MLKPLLESDVRVWREYDAAGINLILNHPEVRPWVADIAAGAIDLSPQVADTDNVLLMGEHGAVFFICFLPGIYECHTQILPKGRGPWAHKFAIAVLDYMFSRTNAWEVTTRIPKGHLGALTLTRSVGFQYEFTSMEPCHFREKTVKASIWRLPIQDWVGRSGRYLKLGQKLHEQMEKEALRLCIKAQPHEEDDFHNQVAGLSIELVRHGQIRKGAVLYNRWAALARHRTIGVVSMEPPIIQMDLGAMRVMEAGIEIVSREAIGN